MNILIGYHDQTNNIYFLKNRKGNIALGKKIFYFPYLLIYRIFWKFIRNKHPIEIAPKIYISSRPDNQEYSHLNIDENTFFYDLSAEMEELPTIKNGSKYYFSPFLDIGTFDINETRQLVDQIYDDHIRLPKNGKILIHCTMGYTRSTIIAILVMEKVLSLPLDDAIINIKNINKKAVIHSYLQDFLKKFNL
jgi:protein-tyrosine phosphatase